jgi:hypothetical protein
MPGRRRDYAVWATAGALAGWSAQAFEARDLLAFNAGPVVVKPRFSFVTSYSDNVYSLPDNPLFERLGLIQSRDDFIFVLSPELRARLGREGGERHLDFTYRFDQYLFVENTDSDSSNHSFSLGAAVAGSRLEYDTRNSIQLLNSVLSGYESISEGVVQPSGNVERNQYNFSHNLAYVLTAKSRLRVEGSLNLREYPGTGLQQARYYDSTDWRVRAGYDYALSQKLRLAGLAHYGQQLRSAPRGGADLPDADIFGGSVTATGNLTAKLSGSVRAGYEFRDFEQGGGSDGYPLVGVSLTQQFSEKTSASLDYNRSGSVSAGTGAATVLDSVGLSFQQVLGTARPWFLNAGVRYQRNEYVDRDLTLDSFQFTAGVARQLRQWATVFLNYSFETASRFAFDYEVNQVSLGLTIGL